MRIRERLRQRVLSWAIRRCAQTPPDFIIGPNQLERRRLLPHNRFFNIYLHKFLRSDPAVPHDHPYASLGWILGPEGYYEECPHRNKIRFWKRRFYRHEGSIAFHRAKYAHRVLILGEPVYTLFAVGPRTRIWGFHCPQGWKPWTEVVKHSGNSNLLIGCE